MIKPGFSRLILVVTMLFAVASGALVMLVVRWSEVWTTRQIDLEIAAEIGDLAAFYEQRRLLALKELVEERVSWRPSLGAAYLLAYKKSGERLAGNVHRWPSSVDLDSPFEFPLFDERGDETGVTIRARAIVLNGAFNLLIGRSVEPRMALARDFARVLPVLALGLGLLGLAAAFAIGRSMLRRVAALNAAARAVENGDLSVRAPGAERTDEFGDLARHVNRMLDRLSALMAWTRSSTDRVAHELRTPMTRLRVRLREAARVADAPAGALIADAIEDTLRLSSIYDSLLDISRIESAVGVAAGLTTLDLRSPLEDVVELYRPVVEERDGSLNFSCPEPLFVRGDNEMLQRLFANLIDNALKFSPEGGSIHVEASAGAGRFSLAIRDMGPGMDPAFMALAFEKFSRGPGARAKDGFGLGLAIVSAIAARHGFTIRAENTNPGLAMIVSGRLAPERAG